MQPPSSKFQSQNQQAIQIPNDNERNTSPNVKITQQGKQMPHNKNGYNYEDIKSPVIQQPSRQSSQMSSNSHLQGTYPKNKNTNQKYPQNPPHPTNIVLPPERGSKVSSPFQPNFNQEHLEDKPLVRQRPYPVKQPQPSENLKNLDNNFHKGDIQRPSGEYVEKQATSNNRAHQIQRKPGVDNIRKFGPSSGHNSNNDGDHQTAGTDDSDPRNFNQNRNYDTGNVPTARISKVGLQSQYNAHTKDADSQLSKEQNKLGFGPGKSVNRYNNKWKGSNVQQNVKVNQPSPEPTKPSKYMYRPNSGNTYTGSRKSPTYTDNEQQQPKGIMTEGGYIRGYKPQSETGWSDLSKTNDASSIFNPYNGFNSKDHYWNIPSDNNYHYYDSRNEWPSRHYYQKPQPHYDYYNIEPGITSCCVAL